MSPTIRFLTDCARTATDRCIEWPWSLGPTGYPQVYYRGRMRKAHQLVLELAGQPQPPPPGHFGLHSCDNPVCVNLRHLRWGTHAENMADARARNRFIPTRARGERCGSSRLTEALVLQIRELAEQGHGQRGTARALGLPRSTVQAVLTGASWGHVGA